MSDATMEQKLRLVRQVRSRYNEDMYDMSNREQVLYGKTSITPDRLYSDRQPSAGEEPAVSSFRTRLWTAILLLLAVIVMDINDMNVAGITTEKIYEVISADYEQALEAWVETISR